MSDCPCRSCSPACFWSAYRNPDAAGLNPIPMKRFAQPERGQSARIESRQAHACPSVALLESCTVALRLPLPLLQSPSTSYPRMAVNTDLGEIPDDHPSLFFFVLYSNEITGPLSSQCIHKHCPLCIANGRVVASVFTPELPLASYPAMMRFPPCCRKGSGAF